jgi:hypothetical protein
MPGDYTIMAFVQIDMVIIGLEIVRTVLPSAPNAPLFTTARCALTTPAGHAWGDISFTSESLGLRVQLTVNVDKEDTTESLWDVHLLRYGDLTEYFAANLAFLPQLDSQTAAGACTPGALCESGILIKAFSRGAVAPVPFTVPIGQLALNGANSIIGRGIQVRSSSSSSNTPGENSTRESTVAAGCVVEAVWPSSTQPPAEQGSTSSSPPAPLPMPVPESVVCRFGAAEPGIRGLVTWEMSEPLAQADADKRVDMTLPIPSVIRGDVVVHVPSVERKIHSKAQATPILHWHLTANDGGVVPGSLSLPELALDGLGSAQTSFVVGEGAAPDAGLAALVGGTLRVSLWSPESAGVKPAQVLGKCVIGYAGPGVEEMRPGPTNIAGPVQQVVAGSCALHSSIAASTSTSEWGPSHARGIVYLKEFQNGLRVSFTAVGLPSVVSQDDKSETPETDLVLRVHELGEADDPTGHNIGAQLIVLEQDPRSLELQVARSATSPTSVTGDGDRDGSTTTSSTTASGSGTWTFYKMLGNHGVLGRSIALVERQRQRRVQDESETPNNGQVVIERTLAQCVVGRAHGSERHATSPDMPPLRRASCRLRPTALNDTTPHNSRVLGTVHFEAVGASKTRTTTRVSYNVAGLNPFPAAVVRWFVRDYGEQSVDAQLSGTVFEGRDVAAMAEAFCMHEAKMAAANHDYIVAGRCTAFANDADPVAKALAGQVGIIDGTGLLSGVALDGLARGTFYDPALALGGFNSIVGRALVVMETDETGTERAVAECTVARAADPDDAGWSRNAETPTAPPPPRNSPSAAPPKPAQSFVLVQVVLSALLLSVGLIAGASCRRNRSPLPFRYARALRQRRGRRGPAEWTLHDGEGDPLTSTATTDEHQGSSQSHSGDVEMLTIT